VAITLAALTSPVFAQDVSQADVSVGYLNVNRTMQGVNVQVTLPMTEHWNFVGEISRASGADCPRCEPKYRDTSILGGFRYAWHPTRRISPFWQIMAGGLHSKAADYYADYCCNLGRRLEPGFTIGYLAIQPGGGVTYMVTPRFGMRGQADFLFAIPDQSEWEGYSLFPRVVASGVIRLGRTR
jgi:hypothetical protein